MKKHSTMVACALVAVVLLAGCTPAGEQAGPSDVGSSAPASSTPSGISSSASPSSTPVSQETQAPPLDLYGAWRQTNSNSAESYQLANITPSGFISIDWMNSVESTSATYWIGTYVAPTDDTASYTWESVADVAKMEGAVLASQDATKQFTYEDGVLTYELSAMGVTMTVEMSRY